LTVLLSSIEDEDEDEDELKSKLADPVRSRRMSVASRCKLSRVRSICERPSSAVK
jgi:hypothetical protein